MRVVPAMRSSKSSIPQRSDGQQMYIHANTTPVCSQTRLTSKKTVSSRGGSSMSNSKMPLSSAGQTQSTPQYLTSNITQSWPGPGMEPGNHSDGSTSVSSMYDASLQPYLVTQPLYSSSMYSTHTLESALPALSPSTSYIRSKRSSLSATPGCEPNSQAEAFHSFHSQVKLQGTLDWPSGSNVQLMIPSCQDDLNALSLPSVSYSNIATNASFLQQQGNQGWLEVGNVDGNNFHQNSRRSEPQKPVLDQSSEPRKLHGKVDRTRTSRKMTTKEEANFICKVKGCGKMFSRSYNYKAHMETHDAARVYPFPCPLSNCNKKFVRKTDLQRHHQSVHMKERNYQCDFCSRFFARKDTLRRHMEDGCSKRFDVNITFNDMYQTSTSNDGEPESRLEALHSPYMSNSVDYRSNRSGTSASPPSNFSPGPGLVGSNVSPGHIWMKSYMDNIENDGPELH